MERRALRELLREFQRLSKNLLCSKSEEARSEIQKLMEGVTSDILGVNLPPIPRVSPIRSQIFFASVYETPLRYSHGDLDGLIECSVFGFYNANRALPLHNHPDIYGFIKVLRGKIQIKSYSWLDPDEEQKLINVRVADGEPIVSKLRPARFSGKTVISSEDKLCATLGPQNGNVHSIMSLEDGASFFDLLIPGYIGRPCTYYADDVENPKLDEIYWLRTTPEPLSARTMRSIPYEPILCID